MFPIRPLGHRFAPEKDGPSYRVIGIRPDVRNDGLTQQTLPEYDTLLRAIPTSGPDRNTRWDATYPKCVSTKPLHHDRQRVEEIDPLIPIELHSMQAEISTPSNRPRLRQPCSAFLLPQLLMVPSAYMAPLVHCTRPHSRNRNRTHWGLPESTYSLIMLEGLRLSVWSGIGL